MWTERKEYSNPDVILVFFAGCLAYHLKWGEGLVLPRMLCTDNSTLSTNFPVCRIGVWLRSYASICMYLYGCMLVGHMLIWLYVHLIINILISYISNMAVSSHTHSSQRGWDCCGILAGFSVISNIFVSFLYFFDFKHLKQSNELSLELDWFFLIIYVYNISIRWYSSILYFGSCDSI